MILLTEIDFEQQRNSMQPAVYCQRESDSMTKWSRDDHRSGATVGEDFGEQSVARRAVDDMRAVDAAAQQLGDALKFGNHAAGCAAIADERVCFIRGET